MGPLITALLCLASLQAVAVGSCDTFSGSWLDIPNMLDLLGRPVCALLEQVPALAELVRNPPNDPPYDLVIVEVFMASCYYAFGRKLNVPMVLVVTTPPFDWMNGPLGNPVNPAVDTSILSKSQSPTTFLERLSNFLSISYTTFMYNIFAREQDELVERVFGPGYPSVVDLIKDTSLVLVNHHLALNGVRPFVPGVVPVGGLHVDDENADELPKEVQKFLDESNMGFIYFSFGSMIRIETFPRRDLDAFYGTFRKIAPVRVLLKVAKPEELPPDLPSNVMTQSWLSQIKVLKHKNIKIFITHGGLMGTQEAIYHGIPMIGFPLFGDQHFNLDSYVRKNIAIKLDRHNITEPVFTRAVFDILNDPTYKRSAQSVGDKFKDTPMTPMDTAAFWVEYIARHGKDALRAPIVDLPWWQASLLDVYGFIVAVILILISIMRIVFRKIVDLFSTKKSKTKVKKN
ncbi:hypothetical protein QAD02_017362 [Eretmocerus hayati]|uniref:Uncharacterized protein n=1 Tax=Eretmocerus hayati TaxID=131215 RepID=A0ACC2PIH2_9HYME|nr:hypothetical protein QAD02_017362 [Eretmocerus hayati]